MVTTAKTVNDKSHTMLEPHRLGIVCGHYCHRPLLVCPRVDGHHQEMANKQPLLKIHVCVLGQDFVRFVSGS